MQPTKFELVINLKTAKALGLNVPLARVMGLRIIVMEASSESQINAAFVAIPQKRAEALLVGENPFLNSRRDQIVALALHHAVPALFEQIARRGGGQFSLDRKIGREL